MATTLPLAPRNFQILLLRPCLIRLKATRDKEMALILLNAKPEI